MNILVFGAGAIGSLFGGLLSKHNKVLLYGRKAHIDKINNNGLKIRGLTRKNIQVSAADSIDKIDFKVDLLILTVKSYDTKKAIKQAIPIINEKTMILSIQNGLDNVEKISKYVNIKNLFASTTTHGVVFTKPGIITHTGHGRTVIGKVDSKTDNRTEEICSLFNKAGINTEISSDILKEIWKKTIVNSSINPVTTIFNCKNGYLKENPILRKLVGSISIESTNIAKSVKIKLDEEEMLNLTFEVIKKTRENYSSMHQSFYKIKKTEIDSINSKLVDIAEKNKVPCFINKCLVYSIKNL